MNVSCRERSSLVNLSRVFRVAPLAKPLQALRHMRTIAIACLVVLTSICTPAAASAVTVDQIVALSKAGVTDTVILALIDRDRTIFPIEPEQLVALKREGVSEAVIIAMLKSG